MDSSRRIGRLFSVAVIATGVAWLSLIGSRDLRDPTSWPPTSQILVWLALLIGAAMAPIPLPKRSLQVRLAPMLEFAALIAFGVPIAAGMVLLAHLGASLGSGWSSERLRAPGGGLIAVLISGSVYSMLGGASGESFAGWKPDFVPLAVAAVTLLMTQHIVALLGDGPRSAVRTRPWLNEALVPLGLEAVLLCFAVPLTLVQVELGLEATVLCALPVLLAIHTGILWEHARRSHFEAVRSLMSAVDASDPFTRGHSNRISQMCLRVGHQLGLGKQCLEELEYAALLHDIGRTAIQHDILVKPQALSRQEHSVLQTHPRIGSEFIERIAFLPRAAAIVHSHHEQPDGNGYPENLSGDAIPVASRIIMVVAAFDAMTSDRPYRSGLSPDVALEELRAKAGEQFFPEVVEALHHLYASGSLFSDIDREGLDPHLGRQVQLDVVEPGRPSIEVALNHAEHTGGSRYADVPILEMPPPARADVVKREFLLSDDGSLKLNAAVLSDTGCIRENNEDTFGMFPGEHGSHTCLLTVADGMGGAAAGEIASRLAVETVRDVFFGEDDDRSPGPLLREALALASETVRMRAAEETHWHGMGTTCVAVAIFGDECVVAHVGDSRAYLIEDVGIQRLTQDHSLEEELALLGSPAGDVAKHVLTRSIGQEGPVEVDLSQKIRLTHGSTLVLCSDGLSNLVHDEEILACVRKYKPDVACTQLVELARERGGPDNITLQIARFESA